jgi:hypothetical protein
MNPMSQKPNASTTVVNSLSSVEGITKSAVPLLGMWLLYKAVPPIVDFFRGIKEDRDHAEQEADQARRDLVETKLREDKKDTAAIQKQIRDEWADRERRKLPPSPRAVRGRWEGNVFVPSVEQPRKKR